MFLVLLAAGLPFELFRDSWIFCLREPVESINSTPRTRAMKADIISCHTSRVIAR